MTRQKGAWERPKLIEGSDDYLVGVHRLARLYGRSPHWSRKVLRGWWAEQQKGGPVRVMERAVPYGKTTQRRLFTTMAVIEQQLPRYRDTELERWRKQVDAEIDRAFRRIIELEARLGIRKFAG